MIGEVDGFANDYFGYAEAVLAWRTGEPAVCTPTFLNGNGIQGEDYYDAYFLAHGTDIISKRPFKGGTMYIPRCCPFDPAHQGGASVAFFVGPTGHLGFKCQHLPGCATKTGADVRDLFEPGWRGSHLNRESSQPPEAGPQIRSIADLPSVSAMPLEKIDFLLEGLLAYSSVNMWSAESGSGKTSIGIKICHCRSTGQPFAGLAVKQGPVLYIDAEQSRPAIQEKFRRLMVEDGDLFKYWGPWAGTPPALNSQILIDYVTACDPKPLIFVDSYVALHPGDENDAVATRAYINQARHLANLGACIVFFHHPGKSESAKTYRGSSDIQPAIDIAYFFTNLGEPGQLGKIVAKNFKTRWSVLPSVLFEYRAGDFISDTRPNAVTKTVTEQLTALLKSRPGLTKSDFEKAAVECKLGQARGRDFLNNGVLTGQIRRESGPHNSSFHYWEGAPKSDPL